MFSAYKLNKQGDNIQPFICVLTCKVMCLYVCVCVCVNIYTYIDIRTSQVALVVKNPPTVQEPQEIQVRFPGQEDPLRDGMAPYSSILTWRVPWWGPWGLKE